MTLRSHLPTACRILTYLILLYMNTQEDGPMIFYSLHMRRFALSIVLLLIVYDISTLPAYTLCVFVRFVALVAVGTHVLECHQITQNKCDGSWMLLIWIIPNYTYNFREIVVDKFFVLFLCMLERIPFLLLRLSKGFLL